MSVLRSISCPILGVGVLAGRGAKTMYAPAVRFVATVAGAALGVVVAPAIEVFVGMTIGMQLANKAADSILPEAERTDYQSPIDRYVAHRILALNKEGVSK